MPTKRCSKCGVSKDLNEFFNDKQAKDGKAFYCKVCSNKNSEKWFKKKKDTEWYKEKKRKYVEWFKKKKEDTEWHKEKKRKEVKKYKEKKKDVEWYKEKKRGNAERYAKKKEKENRTYLKQLKQFLAQLQSHLKTHKIVPKSQTKKQYALWLKTEAGQQILGRFASSDEMRRDRTDYNWREGL
jgi:hypothetical protein